MQARLLFIGLALSLLFLSCSVTAHPALFFCSLPPSAFLQLLHILSFLHLSRSVLSSFGLALLCLHFSSTISISPLPSFSLSFSLCPWWGLIRVDERFLSIALVVFLVPSANGQGPHSLQETSVWQLIIHIYIYIYSIYSICMYVILELLHHMGQWITLW